jgi:hypothetical protein
MRRISAAIVLAVHGLGHLMGFLAAWTTVPVGFSTRPWLLSPGITMSSGVGRGFGLLWLASMAFLAAAGVLILVREKRWRALATGGSLISLITLLPWLNTIAPALVLEATLVDVLVLSLLFGPWSKQVVAAMA